MTYNMGNDMVDDMVLINRITLTLFLLAPIFLITLICLSLIGYIHIAFIGLSLIGLGIWYYCFAYMRVDYISK